MMMTDQPAVEISVAGAGFEQARAARIRASALNSLMNTQRARRDLKVCGRDGMISGLGAVWPQVRNGQVRFTRVRLDQITWDPYDVRYDDPSVIGVVEWMTPREITSWINGVDDDVLSVRRKARITKAVEAMRPIKPQPPYELQSPYDWELASSGSTCGVRLKVTHWWRTASSVDAADGRYVATVQGGGAATNSMHPGTVVMDVDFGRTTLPIVMWSPWPPLEGLVGEGLACQITEAQRAIDYLWLRVIQHAEKLGWHKVLTNGDAPPSDDVLAALAEQEITILPGGADAPPSVIPYSGLKTDDVQLIATIKGNTAQTTGINQILAGGMTQLGAGASGIALAEESDRQVDRFSDVYEEWTTFRLSAARELLNAIEDEVRTSGSFRSRFRAGDGTWARHDWEDLRSPHSEYALDIEEAGQLARTRAGRLAKILAQAEQGLVSQSDAQRALLGTPDLRWLGELTLAPRRRIEADLDQIVRGEYAQPTPDHDLPLAIDLSGKMINLASNQGAEERTLTALAEYRRQAQGLLTSAQRQAQIAEVQAAGAAQAGEQLVEAGTEQAAQAAIQAAGIPGGIIQGNG
jgi:hypothetical protein